MKKIKKTNSGLDIMRVILLRNEQGFEWPADWGKNFSFPLLSQLQPRKRKPSWNNCTTNLPGLPIKSLLYAIWIKYFHISLYKVLFHYNTVFQESNK